MRILVTGGSGFIGSHLSEMHLEKGDHVTVIDVSRPVEFKPDRFISIDLSNIHKSDYDILSHTLKDVDLVYHMASSVGVKCIDRDPSKAIQNLFNINNSIFPLFERYNNRVIFASSSEVYGNNSAAKETDTLKIGSPDTLRWGYACGKLMSEFLLKTYNFPSTVVRFFNVSGPRQKSATGMVLPSFIENALSDNNLIVYGTGNQYRTFCDIRDAIAMLDIIRGDDHIDSTYNIGNCNNTITISHLARKVLRVTGGNGEVIYRDYKDSFSDHHGEIYERKPNIDKISRFYKPKFSVEDIIESICSYERNSMCV